MALLNSFVLTGVLAAFVLYVVSSWIKTYVHLRHIPGPLEATLSKSWLFRKILSARITDELANVNNKYGPLARVGPNWLICSDVNEIRRLWSVHSGWRRDVWYNGFRFDPANDNILTASENKVHHRIRTNVLPGYNAKGITTQENVIDAQVEKLLGLIEKKYVSSKETGIRSMDMARTFLYFTQDATSALGFTTPFGYLDVDEDFNNTISTLEGMLPTVTTAGLFPVVIQLMNNSLVKSFLPKPHDNNGMGKLLGLIKDRVDARYENKAKGEDMLQRFVESKLSRQEVEAETLIMLFGGTDTTATALRMTVFYLSTTPSAYKALQSEIDNAIESGKVTRPVISDAEALELDYLDAVIKEGLRMWPPISGLQLKCSDKDDVVCGYKVPAGTAVGISEFSVMRDQTVFGRDAEQFNPSRWLEEKDPGRLKEMEMTQGLVFASGTRWECLGKRLAYTELRKVLFELFWRYDFAMTDPAKPFEYWNYGATLHEHMNVTITKRVA
ncbi:putative cytochrome P450 E-class, group I [Triangularia verruculosa]|uniref:Cytochrome P450 E-class, group I n=1 Tax=Triangularia verruculosa TaxID=2587418 RepID=A0AAN6XLZ5_9PEZI|nr:putative cytochrome P450 E-class, group I [Triangularia verruculosa]